MDLSLLDLQRLWHWEKASGRPYEIIALAEEQFDLISGQLPHPRVVLPNIDRVTKSDERCS